ncbi:hypothetical protein DQ244_19090 [Blastococcus sp. TBT05-19]|uniref:hypothetical protein n=1 Tax=Blastococcus sp. TBT05-19 TaxID=2250581 RepID=UPI000DE81D76|nr:hypothetical protein [Blastococcus sp. TBT05-19]RBY86040.1 hypothetical protein DQ244_19090 [Blastococcus sp. TBT05-19]
MLRQGDHPVQSLRFTRFGLTATFEQGRHGRFIRVVGEGLNGPAEYAARPRQRGMRSLAEAVSYTKRNIVDRFGERVAA